MPQATQPTTTPTRRSALRFSAAAIVAGFAVPALAAVTTPNLDAELLALCAEAERCEERIREIDQLATETDEECGRACDAWESARQKVAAQPAMTLPGAQAKARVVKRALIREYFWADGGDYCCPDEIEAADVRNDAAVAWSLCDDLLRLGGAA
jgi:hypothetical protein